MLFKLFNLSRFERAILAVSSRALEIMTSYIPQFPIEESKTAQCRRKHNELILLQKTFVNVMRAIATSQNDRKILAEQIKSDIATEKSKLVLNSLYFNLRNHLMKQPFLNSNEN